MKRPMGSLVHVNSLAPCRQCHGPVAGPLGLLQRELFHVSRCPHCQTVNPHPQEHAEAMHSIRTAIYGSLVLAASLSVLLFAPVERLL